MRESSVIQENLCRKAPPSLLIMLKDTFWFAG